MAVDVELKPQNEKRCLELRETQVKIILTYFKRMTISVVKTANHTDGF